MKNDKRSLRLGAAYALLVLCATLLSVDILGIFVTGNDQGSDSRVAATTQQAWQDLGDKAFLELEYNSVVAEIRARLEHEQAFFVLKFTLVGATLYLIFQKVGQQSSTSLERTEITALVAWAAVIAAALTDLRVVANQTFVMTLGGWTSIYEELRLGAPAAHLGWEAYLAENLLSRPFYPALRVSSGILTSLLFCVTAGIFILEPHTLEKRVARVARAGAFLSIGLMTLAALSLRRDAPLAPWLYLGFGICAAMLTHRLIPGSRAASPSTIPPRATNDRTATETGMPGES